MSRHKNTRAYTDRKERIALSIYQLKDGAKFPAWKMSGQKNTGAKTERQEENIIHQ